MRWLIFVIDWRFILPAPYASALKLGTQGAQVTLTRALSKLHVLHIWIALPISNVLYKTLKPQRGEVRIFEHILAQTLVKFPVPPQFFEWKIMVKGFDPNGFFLLRR